MRIFAGFWIALCLVTATHAKSVTETELFAGDQACECGPNSDGCSFTDGVKICKCKEDYEQKGDKCEVKCDCKNGSCIVNDKGEYVCTCPPEWGLLKKARSARCIECECGKNSNCTFQSGSWPYGKRCLCKVGYEDQNGICKVSRKTCEREIPYCLRSGGVCVEEEEGKINCMCESGRYFLADGGCTRLCECKNGWCIKDDFDRYRCTCAPEWGVLYPNSGIKLECKKCNCGKDSNCTFFRPEFTDGKRCICKEGYADRDGICEKCDCGGPNTKKVCSFSWDGKIICKCQDGYSDNYGKCEECRCDDTLKACIFVDGRKTCKCKDGFSEIKGTCIRCECGETSRPCKFAADGKKICECKDGFSDNQGFCVECRCGENSESCKYVNGRKTCKCKDGFFVKNGTCVDPCAPNPCQNEGKCEVTDNVEYKCTCEDGYGGRNCEERVCTVVEMQYCRPAECEVTGRKGKEIVTECVCEDDFDFFDENSRSCKKINPCIIKKPCENGATCHPKGIYEYRCECQEGFIGDKCNEFTCTPKEQEVCGKVTCQIKDSSREVTCVCPDGELFDGENKECKGIQISTSDTTQNQTYLWTTEGTSESDWLNSTITTAQTTADIDICTENPCQNGGTCLVVGNTSKCVCRKPYLGMLCETDPCSWNPCKNGGLCKVENDTIACFCKQPFAGEFCESPPTCPSTRIDVYVITLIAISVFLAVVLLFVTCILCQRFHVTK